MSKPLWICFVLLLGLNSCCNSEDAKKAYSALYSKLAKDRNDGALMLARCGETEAGKAVPRLIQLMYDENIGVQSAAAYALRKIDTKEARAALEQASKRR